MATGSRGRDGFATAMADKRTDGRRPGGRPRPNDPLMQEVRWRLFRRQDLPARLRRLQRMEETAFSERTVDERRDRGESEGG
jgi:hypothetical protein